MAQGLVESRRHFQGVVARTRREWFERVVDVRRPLAAFVTGPDNLDALRRVPGSRREG